MVRMLSLFSGIGGIDLAAQWAGIETVAFCEIDPFCQKVLKKHWPDVPIFSDIRTLTKEVLDDAGVGRIDIVAGGHPCPPYSYSGQRKGAADDRHLWPEMRRVISEIRPDWVVNENVAGFASLGLDEALSDLERLRYTAQSFNIPACAINAPHERQRIFTVAYAKSEQRIYEPNIREATARLSYDCVNWQANSWDETESKVCRVDDGIPGRMDRCRALGNAVDPRQIYPIFAAIMEVERICRQ
jgi:DNA (cytosine-5)-methyltransferase 1